MTNLFFVFCSSSRLSTLCLSCPSSLLIHPILLEQKMGSPIERSEVRSIEYVWPLKNAWLCDQRCLLTRICMNDGTCLMKMKSTGFYLEWQYLTYWIRTKRQTYCLGKYWLCLLIWYENYVISKKIVNLKKPFKWTNLKTTKSVTLSTLWTIMTKKSYVLFWMISYYASKELQ